MALSMAGLELEPGAMNRFQAIGPKVFGAGSPWPVLVVPARRAVAVSCTTARAMPSLTRSTRCLATPSKSMAAGRPEGSSPSSQMETLRPMTWLPSSMNERPSSRARAEKPA
jgi:hypothetical protein